MWDYESCKTCAHNGKVCDECMQCGEYGTSYYQGIIQEEIEDKEELSDDIPVYADNPYPTGYEKYPVVELKKKV